MAEDEEETVTREREESPESDATETSPESDATETPPESETTVRSGSGTQSDAASPASDPGSSPGGTSTRDYDTSAEEFLELESELAAESTEPVPAGMRRQATIVGAERVGREAVPGDYPVTITEETVIALRLSTDREETTAYFGLSGDDDSRLARLLALHGIEPGSFADLNGRPVLVEREAGYDLPVVPSEPPVEEGSWKEGILGAQAVNVLVALGLAAGIGVGLGGALLLAILVNLVVLPYVTYRDGKYLETNTDWGQTHSPLFWASLQVVPGLNFAVTAAYLATRKGAEPLA